MTDSTLGDVSLVDDEAGLAKASDLIAQAPWLGLAVERNATRSYRPRVCLVQVNVAGTPLALDALAFEGRRPSPIAAALGRLSEGATVIVHGGEYALDALARDLQVRFGRLIDTQQAAVLLGLPATGLRALCRSLLGVELAAPLSADWSRRPLAPALVAQALEDVAHLGPLHEALRARIREHDLEDELALASVPPPPRSLTTPDTPDPGRFRHIAGAPGLPPEGRHLLGALVRWRDLKARELDLPPGRLIPNARLVDLAHAPELCLARLENMRFHSRLLHADVAALRRAVTLALAPPEQPRPAQPTPRSPPAPPASPRKGTPTPATKARLARLKSWRRGEAQLRGVGLQAVLPLVALEHLAFFPATALADVPGLGRRRIERYATQLAALLAGE